MDQLIMKISILILGFYINTLHGNVMEGIKMTPVPFDLNLTTTIEPNLASREDACEQTQSVNYIRDQTDKFKHCISAIEVKLFPFNCKQYKTIVNCFHDFTTHVELCFEKMRDDWKITNQILANAAEYMCDPRTELLHSFYLHGGKSCLSGNELHHCGPSFINTLLNNSEYYTFSKQLLSQNYSFHSCSDEENNAKCTLHGISLYCKEQPNITLIADNLHQIVMKHSGCSSSAFAICANVNTLITILFATLILRATAFFN